MQSELGPLTIDHRDFLLNREVRDMPPASFKAYVLLLCELWEGGSLPSDLDSLARYAGVSPTIMKNKVWGDIANQFFEVGDDLLDNEFTLAQRKKAVRGLVARQKMAAAARRRAAQNRRE